MEDRTKEQVKFYTEVLKMLLVLFLTTGGSTLALIVDGPDVARKVILSASGILISISIGVFALWMYKKIERILKP